MGTLQIRLFGTLQLERDGQTLTRTASKRVKDLFSYLLLQRETVHSREHLAGVFWGDLDSRRARHCFNTALWRLHRVLGQTESRENPYLTVDSQQIAFNNSSDYLLDVAEFETRISWAEQMYDNAPEQRAALYRQAISLYQGDLLIDCYDDWALVERERLRGLYLRALSQLFSYHAARQEHDEAIGYGRRILASDPLREEIHRDLISVHLAANQPADALRQYRSCEAILERELGIAPMPETQALLRRMLGTGGAIRLSRQPESQRVPVNDSSPASLAEALIYLREAAISFELASDRLRQASELVQEVIDREAYQHTAPGAIELTAGRLDLSETLQRAIDLVEQASLRQDVQPHPA